MDNEKVFNSELASDIYKAYTEFFLKPDFSGLKSTDMANHVADYLAKKGYSTSNKKEERHVIGVQEHYNIMKNCVERRIRYSDGTVEFENVD